MKRRESLALLGGASSAALLGPAPVLAQNGEKKVFRYSFRVAETGFDPAQISDVYSRTITPHIFESPYEYDPLARPAKVRPLTAVGMPEVSADFTTWTVKLKPGIFFADDPAFKGQRRELVAEDYVYSFKRFLDPAVKGPALAWVAEMELLGLAELRKQALDSKRPFNYDQAIEGLKALDRYTVQFKMARPSPRFIYTLAAGDLIGAVAREVVEFYGDKIMAHPVGTGPFKLVQWRRSSFIALERNAAYRERLYTAEPAEGDREGQAILAKLKGKRLPMIDRVEISIIEENQPRWLTFRQGKEDMLIEVPAEFIEQALPGGQVAPALKRERVSGLTQVRSDQAMTVFNMEDPVVGGYTPARVALRRAIGLALDVEAEIRLARRNQAIVAQQPMTPHTYAFDPNFRSEMGQHSLSRAKALLDMFGYVDRDGDGWRETPEGQPIALVKNTQPDQQNRQLDDMWRRDMKRLGIRVDFKPQKWPENLKAARAGTFQIWGVGSLAADPDGQTALNRYQSKHIGGQNLARFKNAEMDELCERIGSLPDGPERKALFDRTRRIAVAFMPYKAHVHRMVSDLARPWVLGYRRPLFWQDFWQHLDIDTSQLPQA
jgi:ABC-type transport system substrate-binding protein